jgi:hypothetical protein
MVLILPGCSSKSTEETDRTGTASKTADTRLSGAEIQRLLSNNTITMYESGTKATLEMYGNGKLYAVKSKTEKNDGRWAVEDDQLCIQFKRWGYGDKICYAVTRDGSSYKLITKTGLESAYFTVAQGVKHSAPSGTKKTRAKRQAASAAAPDVIIDEPFATETPGPSIQESSQNSYNPQSAKSDLRMIYRNMSRNCPGCNLANIDLSEAGLAGANMAGANLKNANLSNANLNRANLKGAILVGANLAGANLSGANLAGADLERADLTGTNLERANLRGASINGAIGLNMKGAIR